MPRAWRGLERFAGRSSLRTWLYRIAANVCLDALEARPRTHWIEPVPDARVLPAHADPSERAALLLTEVLDWSAAEVAESLDTSVAAVNSAIQRARDAAGRPAGEGAGQARLILARGENRLLAGFGDPRLASTACPLTCRPPVDHPFVPPCSLPAVGSERAGRQPGAGLGPPPNPRPSDQRPSQSPASGSEPVFGAP